MAADVGGTDAQAQTETAVSTGGGAPAPSGSGGAQYGAPLRTTPHRTRAQRRRAHERRLRRQRAERKRIAAEKKRKAAATPAPTPTPAPSADGPRFPVPGDHTFGGKDAVFGAKRNGHIHQGQDIVAAEGEPVVSPVNGTVYWRAYQASAAGYYVIVLDPTTNRAYGFMHLQEGSIAVSKGAAVTAGQQLGLVGHTGDAQGPHLHFEIWENGWYNKDGAPIDPLPDLTSWDTYS